MRTLSKALAALALTAPLLAGCFSFDPAEPSVWRPESRATVQRDIHLDVNAAAHILKAAGDGLAPGEAEQLGAFVASQGSPWSMDVRVQPLSPAGAKAVREVEMALIYIGVQADRIGREPMGARAGDGDVAVTVRHISARVAGCPDWSRANLIDHSEMNSSNFGCATADNLARMIADPRELSVGRPTAPASGPHAAGAVARYNTDKVKPLIKRATGGSGGAKGE
ncbi:MAG: CpaD family pilus assembly lipoprotein [Alphaproteobacteria bacterium]